MFFREAVSLENIEAANRIIYTRTAVWGDPDDVKQLVKELRD